MILLQIPERGQARDVVFVGLRGATLDLANDSADDSANDSAGAVATVLPAAAAELATSFVRHEAPDATAGQRHTIHRPGQVPSRVVLVGLGDESPDDLRVAGVAMGRAISELPESKTVAVTVNAPGAAGSQALAEGLVLGGYRYVYGESDDDRLHTVDLVGRLDRAGLTAGDEAADATGWARDLGNTPAADLTPARFGELAEQQLTASGCSVLVRDEPWLRAQGFGGLLAVGGGAAAGPRLIEASYRPRRARGAAPLKHIVLVGKGITFDTGGLNLKPADGMRMMHTDMCGGAAVLGAIQYAAMQKLPVRVTALVPAAENAVSQHSMRPSDVITHYGGRTTEIGNTDAEGRLVLADALAYAVATLKPDVILDIATLTGAMKVALGMHTAGYFANDDEVAAALEAASRASGEAIWRMPLEHHYVGQLDSPVADARNDPGSPGGITAALFLQPFTGDVRWAHLDIAGPARADADGPVFPRGATGFGTRLLASYLDSV